MERKKTAKFNYDIYKYFQENKYKDFNLNIDAYKSKNKNVIAFKLTNDQHNQIDSYNKLFGNTLEGISRTLSRVYIKNFLEHVLKDLI